MKKAKVAYYIKQRIKPLLYPFDYINLQKGQLPAYYFDGCQNVGDLITHYLLQHYYLPAGSAVKSVQVYSHRLPHLMGVGSILRRATSSSWVWGSGLIGETHLPETLDPSKVLALRGPHTRSHLNAALGNVISPTLPLGDPALLLPRCYYPTAIVKKYAIGIIPHYVDVQRVRRLLGDVHPDVRVIDVRQKPETFIDEIVGCEAIFSSSLHGLIISDAYQVPNAWIKLSDLLIGGKFKFKDYYATTDNPLTDSAAKQTAYPVEIDTPQALSALLDNARAHCCVSHYTGDLTVLAESLTPFLDAMGVKKDSVKKESLT